MRLSLTFPSVWSLKEGPNDQLAAILPAPPGGGTLPDLVVTYGPITLKPDEPAPWMEQTARSDLPRDCKVTTGRRAELKTEAGWPLRLLEAEVQRTSGELVEIRLCAFFTFMEHAAVAIVRAANHDRLNANSNAILAILGTGRPDWRGEPACLTDVWDLERPGKPDQPTSAPVRSDVELRASLAEIDAALAEHPSARDHVRRGELLVRLDRPAEALDALRAALALEPALEPAHYFSGVALAALGRRAEAITAWEAALAQSPDHVDTHYNIAQARFLMKEYEAALAAFQTVARLDPDDFMTTRKIAQCLYALGRHDEGAAARSRFREQWATTSDPRARFITEFVFDQFEGDGFWVHALETLGSRTASSSVNTLLTFRAVEADGDHDHPLPACLTVETSDAAKQAGTPFVLGLTAGPRYRVIGMAKELPPYAELKAEIVKLLAEALRSLPARS